MLSTGSVVVIVNTVSSPGWIDRAPTTTPIAAAEAGAGAPANSRSARAASALRFGRSSHISVTSAHPVLGPLHFHAEAVILAVRSARRRVADDVLMVQLVGDARSRVDQIRAVLRDLGASPA